MSEGQSIIERDIAAAYAEYERKYAIRNFKWACALGIVLMPAGWALDHFVYPDWQWRFLRMRLLCSGLIAIFYGALQTPLGRRWYRGQGVALFMLPATFIAWMILVTEGDASPYYAGLNLVLLMLGFVLQWTFQESLLAAALVVLLYLSVCLIHHSPQAPWQVNLFVNNLYFLTLTGVIVVVGSYLHSKLRYAEFAARHELDRNRSLLEESNRKLVEMDKIKSHFFANISHELRTPLTLLIAPLESLMRRPNQLASSESTELMATMHANSMRLLKLINDLLDLVRLDSGRMEIRADRIAMDEFLRGVSSSIRRMAEDKRLRLETNVAEEVGTVLGDRDKLEKILLNLLFNAVKFTPSGGAIELKCEVRRESLVLQVRDTGMGITAEQLPFLFKRFWQADTSSQRKFQGVGIGLALVKELVEIQKGEVSVQTQSGQGTTFTILLPLLRATTSAAAAATNRELASAPSALETVAVPNGEPPEDWLVGLYRRAEMFPAMTSVKDSLRPMEFPTGGNRAVLLIADDEPDMLRFLKSQLDGHFQVVEAVDGNQAVQKAAQYLPEIILCDMMMPEKDGLEVCRELREKTSTQNIPIIMLTARADEETKLALLSAGANDFLSKPFSITELHLRLTNLHQAYQLQRQLIRQKQILEATIEQLKETEIQLVQSEKLASLGRMSAGIIHEINNPLNYAKTGLYSLRKQGRNLPQAEKVEFDDILKDVEDGVDRVKNIVSDLRKFTHPGADRQFSDTSVAAMVTTALRLVSSELKDRVQIEKSIPDDLTVHGNQNQLIQVLVNLLQNAMDAMKKKTYAGEAPTIRIEAGSRDGKTLVTVRDNGPGISEEIRMKVFDPFFTTKDVGEGMGLGLSICHRIIESHGGRIIVSSEPGRHCEFALEFPAGLPEYSTLTTE